MAREKCGLLAVPRTLPGSRDVLPVHGACKVLGTLRTTAKLVRVFMLFN